MSEFGLNISVWQRLLGHVFASVTNMVMRVHTLEEKESLSERDKLIIFQLVENLENLDA